MKNLRSWMSAVGLGAGLMYLFDPDHGPRRRAQFRDQIDDWKHIVGDGVHRAQNLSHRAGEVILETRQVATGQRDWKDIVALRGDKPADRARRLNPRSLAFLGGGLMLLSSLRPRSRMATAGRWIGVGLLVRGMMAARSEQSHLSVPADASEPQRAHGDEVEFAVAFDCGSSTDGCPHGPCDD
jgi:hypothetical protein